MSKTWAETEKEMLDMMSGPEWDDAPLSKWVCERHPDKPWQNPDGTTCCGGAGKLRDE